MRYLELALLSVGAIMVAAPSASAQPPSSDVGRMALVGSVGQAIPAGDSDLGAAAVFAGTLDGSVTPHFAWRAEVGTVGFDAQAFRFDKPLRSTFVGGSVLYAVALDAWRPYASLGLGFYRFSLNAGPISHGSNIDTKIAPNVGGGIEFRIRQNVAVVGDVRYHAIGDVIAVLQFKGSFTTISVGVKRYF